MKSDRTIISIVRQLFQKSRSTDGLPVLAVACAHGREKVAMELLAAGADPEARGSIGAPGQFSLNFKDTTPLVLAAAFGHPQIVTKLLRRGANPNVPMQDGRTALHWCSQVISEARDVPIWSEKAMWKTGGKMPTELLAAEAVRGDTETRPRRANSDNEVVATKEMIDDYMATVRCLVAAGARVNARDKSAKTPIDYIRDKKRNADLVALLTRAGARP